MALTQRQLAESDIYRLRQSIRQMFRGLSNLELTSEDRAAIVRSVEAVRDLLTLEIERFERGELSG
jgi:acyl-[acyl carrier protein]--UDP-N-acetylglucosamine O-acyltransferase